MTSLHKLPSNLPIPLDDGACDHLQGAVVPSIPLTATNGEIIDLAALKGRTVLYIYPRTGRPDQALPEGWDSIAGARGCTPQSCAFRDHYRELQALNTAVYGLSTQTSDYQQEAADRLHLPYLLLSDADLTLTNALHLPTFTVESMRLLKRVTLIIRDAQIEHVFYPVFPPDQNAADVLQWLNAHP